MPHSSSLKLVKLFLYLLHLTFPCSQPSTILVDLHSWSHLFLTPQDKGILIKVPAAFHLSSLIFYHNIPTLFWLSPILDRNSLFSFPKPTIPSVLLILALPTPSRNLALIIYLLW